MRTATLALTSFMLAGAAFAQQTTPAKPATAATTQGAAAAPKPAAPVVTIPAPATPTPLPNALTDAQAKEMLEVTGSVELKGKLEHEMITYFHSSAPFLPQDVSDDLEQSFQKIDLDTPIIAIYKAHITTTDADAIIAFCKTPAGKSMMETLPGIMQQSQQVGMQLGRKTVQEVFARHRQEIEAAQKQYREEHMPKAAPTLNNAPAAPGQPGTSATPAKPGTATPAPETPQQPQ